MIKISLKSKITLMLLCFVMGVNLNAFKFFGVKFTKVDYYNHPIKIWFNIIIKNAFYT